MELQSLANIIREDVKGTKSVLKLVRKKKQKRRKCSVATTRSMYYQIKIFIRYKNDIL